MEEMTIKYEQITLQQLKDGNFFKYSDPYNILKFFTPSMKKAFLCQPTGFNPNEVCAVFALDGEKLVGCEMCFGSRLISEGEIIRCQGATTLFTHPDYRKYGVGSDLMLICAKLHPLKNNFIAGISQMAHPIYKAMHYNLFSFPRFIFLRKSKCAIQFIFKTDNKVIKFIEFIADCCLWLYRKIVFAKIAFSYNGLVVEKVTDTPQEVEDIVLQDDHKYKELHDKLWFDWCLNNRFIENDDNSKSLYVVKNQKNEIIAFFVNKIEFLAKASTRGFKNVRLGTVMEWGIRKGENLTEFQLQILAVKTFPDNVDGVQVATTNKETAKKFRRIMLFPMGNANNAALIKSVKDNSIKDISNWRIRIAGGDTLIE